MSSGSVLQLLVSETDPDKLLNCLIMNKLIFLDHRQDKQDTLKAESQGWPCEEQHSRPNMHQIL